MRSDPVRPVAREGRQGAAVHFGERRAGDGEAQVAALDALRAEFEAKRVAVNEGSWGYRVLVVDDPDGNQLFFNYPNESASGKTVDD